MAIDRTRRPPDPFAKAEAAFRKITTPPRMKDPERPAAPPGTKEQVTLRIDREVLDHFQADGPGWQDRINDALRKAAGK